MDPKNALRPQNTSSPWSEIDPNKPTRYPQLPDARIVNYGFNFYYASNGDKYSLSAALNQTEFQKETAGSWFIMPFYNHVELSRGTKFILGTDPNAVQIPPDLRNSQLDTVGMAVGYGHAWIRERYFLAVQAGLGPGVQFQKIESDEGNKEDSLNISGKFNLNLAAGRNLKNSSFGGRFLLDSLVSSVAGVHVYSTLASAQVFYGVRF